MDRIDLRERRYWQIPLESQLSNVSIERFSTSIWTLPRCGVSFFHFFRAAIACVHYDSWFLVRLHFTTKPWLDL
jgi:hypothetical protein